MKHTLALSAAALLWVTTAQADPFTDAVIEKYRGMDFDYVEVKSGLTQVKVEAIKGTDKIEVIYDKSTGMILKQENERAESDEIGRTGFEFDARNRDFLDDDDDDDEDEDDDRRSGRDDDDDDDDRSGRDDDHDDDDDEDDDSDDDHSSDDDDDDDDNSGRGNSDDD